MGSSHLNIPTYINDIITKLLTDAKPTLNNLNAWSCPLSIIKTEQNRTPHPTRFPYYKYNFTNVYFLGIKMMFPIYTLKSPLAVFDQLQCGVVLHSNIFFIKTHNPIPHVAKNTIKIAKTVINVLITWNFSDTLFINYSTFAHLICMCRRQKES